MIPGVALAFYYGKVTARRRGVSDGPDGKPIPDWLVDVEVGGERLVEGCRVIGPLLPRIHKPARPSYALVGFTGGMVEDAFCIPDPKTSEKRPDEFAYHQWFLECDKVAIHVHDSGQVTIRGRSDDDKSVEQMEADGDADWRLRIDADGSLFQMLGGGYRMARGRESGEDGAGGDKIAINSATSPLFAAWVDAVSVALGLANPLDPVPEFDGQGGDVPDVPPGVKGLFQACGELMTGSAKITGK